MFAIGASQFEADLAAARIREAPNFRVAPGFDDAGAAVDLSDFSPPVAHTPLVIQIHQTVIGDSTRQLSRMLDPIVRQLPGRERWTGLNHQVKMGSATGTWRKLVAQQDELARGGIGRWLILAHG